MRIRRDHFVVTIYFLLIGVLNLHWALRSAVVLCNVFES